MCKRAKATSNPCSSSLSLTNGTIVKLNGKKVESIDEPLIKFHKHKVCEITEDELVNEADERGSQNSKY